MLSQKTKFALFFGNRGLFPASLIASARREMAGALKELGHKVLSLPEAATRCGAVETVKEGAIYAKFLQEHRGEYGGVILSLPNFGDESGAIAALQDCGVPILIQAYPDDLDKMRPELRRDSFCGKFSVMDVFCQYGLPFTALKPHTVHPKDKQFAQQVDYFDRLCRVAGGLKRVTVGAIGARTTPFKTVRIDELALQRYGITMETSDLSDVFARMTALKTSDRSYKKKAEVYKNYTCWKGVPEESFEKLVKLGVVIDSMIERRRF